MNTSYLAVVGNHQFRKLWLGQIISQIALNMLYFVLVIHVYSVTRSNTAVSLMLLTFGIPAIIFGVLAGDIVDHFDKRKVMVFCNLSRVFVLLIFFFVSSQSIIYMYIISVVVSILTQLFIPAEAPSIPLLVKGKQLLTANSLFTISFYVSTVFGFILAGPAVRILGNHFVYIGISVLMFIAAYYVYLLPPLGVKISRKESLFNVSRIKVSVWEGISYIQTHTRIKHSLYLMTLSQSLIATLMVLAPGFADRILTIDLSDASILVMGPAAVGLILGAYLVGGFGTKVLKGVLILVGIIATGVTLLLLSLLTSAYKPGITFYFFKSAFSVSNLALGMILLILLGVWNALISVPANTILQEDSKKEVRGRVYGVLTALTGGVSFLPVVFSGILADVVGVGKTLAILGLCILGIGVYQSRVNRQKSFLLKGS